MALCAAFALQVASIGAQIQKAVLHLLGGVSGYKRAFALAAHDQIFGSQLIDCLAHRALADLEACCQLHFTGDQFSGAPFASFQTLQDQALDLLVQRAEGWGGDAGTTAMAGVVVRGCVVGAGHSWF